MGSTWVSENAKKGTRGKRAPVRKGRGTFWLSSTYYEGNGGRESATLGEVGRQKQSEEIYEVLLGEAWERE